MPSRSDPSDSAGRGGQDLADGIDERVDHLRITDAGGGVAVVDGDVAVAQVQVVDAPLGLREPAVALFEQVVLPDPLRGAAADEERAAVGPAIEPKLPAQARRVVSSIQASPGSERENASATSSSIFSAIRFDSPVNRSAR